MIRLLADENFDGRIIAGLVKRKPDVDIPVVQKIGLGRTPDPAILEWAAREGRILLTHDGKTMRPFAYERVRRGEPMPGVILVARASSIGRAIEDVLLLIEGSLEDEFESGVHHVPL